MLNCCRVVDFWMLTKFRQTLLLVVTGCCAYIISKEQVDYQGLLSVFLALYLSVSGCTVFNMLFDSDIDAKMERTSNRPLPRKAVSRREAVVFGFFLSALGLILAFSMSFIFGFMIVTGFFFDLVVYTLWLKRITPLSILWGGVSGGMPVIAGRVLATGQFDFICILFGLSILLWIPSHILTLVMCYAKDYKLAGIPLWPNIYGFGATRRMIGIATVLNAFVFIMLGALLNINIYMLAVLVLASTLVLFFVFYSMVNPLRRKDFVLFKAASVYMLLAFIILTVGSIYST